MYACMHKHARVSGSGSMLPQCRKLDALRLLLRPFLDKSRAVVATCTWLAEYIVFDCPCTYAFTKPADFECPREKVVRLAEQQVG